MKFTLLTLFLLLLVPLPIVLTSEPQAPCAAARSRLATLEAEIARLETSIPNNKPQEVIDRHMQKIERWHQQHDAEVSRLRQQLAGSACQPVQPNPCDSAVARLAALAVDLRQTEESSVPTNKPEEIFERQRQKILRWHQQNDAEVNRLKRLLDSTQCPRTRVHVMDENGANIAGAAVFAAGKQVGFTDQNGVLDIRPVLSKGATLVARKLILEQHTNRQQHSAGSTQDWNYRVYITSVGINPAPPPDPCDTSRARLIVLNDDLRRLEASAPPPDKPEAIQEQFRRRIAQWHRDHDAEVAQLKNELATALCSDPAVFTGTISTSTISDPNVTQELRVLRNNTLIGMHWLVSLEWDASQTELAAIKNELAGASQRLYDATDGQFIIEQAELFDDAALWDEADLLIFAAPNTSFRANVDWPRGDFLDRSFDSWIHVARDDDASVIAHEFGHYGFDVGDEYEDGNDKLHCTNAITGQGWFGSGPNASCMMWQPFIAPKLCSRRPNNPHVDGTRQGSQDCWSHLIEEYRDTGPNARWVFQSPDTRGLSRDAKMPPIPVVDWKPRVTIDNRFHDNLCQPITQTFLDSNGQPIVGSRVFVQTTYGQVIGEGATLMDDPNTPADESGMVTLTGVHVGDNMALLGGGLLITATRQVTSAQCTPTLIIQPGPTATQTRMTPQSTQLSVKAEPAVTRGQMGITVRSNRPLQTVPTASLVLTGQQIGRMTTRTIPPQIMVFQQATQSYVGSIALPPGDIAGTIWVTATDANGQATVGLGSITATQVNPAGATDVFSIDGILSVTIPANNIPANGQIVISSSEVSTAGLPQGVRVVNGPFNIQAAQVNELRNPATLRFQQPHSSRQNIGVPPLTNRSLVIYRFDQTTGRWVSLGGNVLPSPIDIVTLRVNTLGTYVLVTPI